MPVASSILPQPHSPSPSISLPPSPSLSRQRHFITHVEPCSEVCISRHPLSHTFIIRFYPYLYLFLWFFLQDLLTSWTHLLRRPWYLGGFCVFYSRNKLNALKRFRFANIGFKSRQLNTHIIGSFLFCPHTRWFSTFSTTVMLYFTRMYVCMYAVTCSYVCLLLLLLLTLFSFVIFLDFDLNPSDKDWPSITFDAYVL